MDKVEIKKSDCPICNGTLVQKQRLRGAYITYTQNINIGDFNFIGCTKCGYVLNKNFKPIDFNEANYKGNSNIINNDNDLLIENHILFCLKDLQGEKKSKSKINLIELGAGSRLELLSSLQKELECEAHAIDPLYKDSLSNIQILGINFIDEIDKLNLIQKHNVLILRNVLEYLEPSYLSDLINKLFKDDGYIFAEIQPINSSSWGSIFTFTEYRNFYTNLALDKLIKKTNKHIKWISMNYIYGEKRIFISGKIINNFYDGKVIYNSDIKSICNNIKNLKKFKKINLWGSGGRSLMFLYNEGSNLVDRVVDPSKDRQGIKLPGLNKIESPSIIRDNEVIILLNSRYLDIAKSQSPNSSIIHTLDINM